MNTLTPEKTEVAAVGRVATFGSLFDCRTNRFLHSALFSKEFDKGIIQSADNWYTKIELSTNNSFEEKFHMLDISADLKLSILSGLIEVKGSGAFLKDVKKSARSAKASFVYSATTKYESININDERLIQCIDMYTLTNTNATHVVVGISWGGKAIISVEDSNSEGKDALTVQGNMQAALSKLAKGFEASGKASAKFDESVADEMRNFDFKLFGDLSPITTPQTIAEALEFIRIAPTKIKEANDGKGKAITYSIYPIKSLRNRFFIEVGVMGVKSIVNHISRETVRKCVSLFDDMNIAEQKLNDMVNDVNCYSDFIEPLQLGELKELRNNYELFQHRIRDQLANILNTSDEVRGIEQTVQEAKHHQLSPARIEDRLRSMHRLYREIAFIKILVKKNVKVLDAKTDFKLFLLKNMQHDVFVVCYNFQQNMDETMESFFNLSNRVYRSPPLFAAVNLCLDGVPATLADGDKLPSIRIFRNGSEIQLSDLTGSDGNAGIYRPLIRNKSSAEPMSGRPLAVLIGPSGVGKTKLINGICGTEHIAWADMSRVTNNLNMHSNICGKHSFAMIDTPGNDDESNYEQYASTINDACSAAANSVVFLVLAYESRFEKFANTYWQFDSVLEDRNVVILISHMDYAESPNSDFKQICDELDDNGCKSSNVIFYSDKSSMHSLADSIYACLCDALN